MGPTANRACINTTGWKSQCIHEFIAAPAMEARRSHKGSLQASHKGLQCQYGANATKGVSLEAIGGSEKAFDKRVKEQKIEAAVKTVITKLPRI
jgi:hypothetical protein